MKHKQSALLWTVDTLPESSKSPQGLIGEVPFNRFAKTSFEGFLLFPAKTTFDFWGINRVTHIMARSIFDIYDQVFVTLNALGFIKHKLFKQDTERPYHINVSNFVTPIDVEGFSVLASKATLTSARAWSSIYSQSRICRPSPYMGNDLPEMALKIIWGISFSGNW